MGGNKEAISFPVTGIKRILIFNNEESLREALEANDHIQYLFGLDAMHEMNFPGVYIAGFKEVDSEGHYSLATQKL